METLRWSIRRGLAYGYICQSLTAATPCEVKEGHVVDDVLTIEEIAVLG